MPNIFMHTLLKVWIWFNLGFCSFKEGRSNHICSCHKLRFLLRRFLAMSRGNFIGMVARSLIATTTEFLQFYFHSFDNLDNLDAQSAQETTYLMSPKSNWRAIRTIRKYGGTWTGNQSYGKLVGNSLSDRLLIIYIKSTILVVCITINRNKLAWMGPWLNWTRSSMWTWPDLVWLLDIQPIRYPIRMHCYGNININ